MTVKDGSAVRRAERLFILSSCCGVTGETVLTDSAVIMLYLASLGAGNTGLLFSTSVLPLFNGLAVIPMAVLAPRFGVRKLVLASCAVSCMGYLAASLAPWFGFGAKTVLWGITCAALVQAGFIAGWFPLLNSFVSPETRVAFLGRMRFFHQLCAAVFVLLSGWFIHGGESAGRLFFTVLLASLIFCGRFFCILAVPPFPEEKRKDFRSWRQDLAEAASLGKLRRFSFYQILFNAGSFGILPLALLCLKRIGLPDGVTVIVSGSSFVGMMLGYWLIRHLAGKFSEKGVVMLLCALCLPSAVGFALLRSLPGTLVCILLALSLCGASFAVAAFSVVSSAVVMSCAGKENGSMTMAFGNAFYYGSAGLVRILLSCAAGAAWFGSLEGSVFGSGFGLLFILFAVLMTLSLLVAPWFFRKEC